MKSLEWGRKIFKYLSLTDDNFTHWSNLYLSGFAKKESNENNVLDIRDGSIPAISESGPWK